jgi:hypothetical protein
MIQLPINEKELQYIIDVVKHIHPQLHSKLWSYKINKLGEKQNGIS